MCLSQQQHTDSGLADAAAHGQGQFAGKQRPMERQFSPFFASGLFELFPKRLRVHTDPHGGYLKFPFQNIIPEQNVTVQLPVIIVGRTSVMLFTIGQAVADLHDKHSFMCFCIGPFPLFCR